MPRPSRAAQAAAGQRHVPAWRENLESLLWAVGLALLIRTFIMAPFKIPSGSMRPTLVEGDRILVNKFLYHLRPPQRGEIVVFYYPTEWHSFSERSWQLFDASRPFSERFSKFREAGRPFIKRLVAMEGETVELRDGQVFVNGEPLDGTGIFRATHYYNQGSFGQVRQKLQVPEGSLYVLGDNSASSHDSRFWGFVPKRLLIGRAMGIFWPPKRIRALR